MNNSTQFILTENHIKLLRRMYVGWQDCETGAPEIDPKRPYGNSDVAPDIEEILTGAEPHDDMGEKRRAELMALHRETEQALQIILVTGAMVPGTYALANRYDHRSWYCSTPSGGADA